MPKIFISYGRDGSHGQNLATEAQQQLQVAGFEVFRDVIGLKPGDVWYSKLEFELENSDLVVLIVSEKVRSSDWVHNEISMAREIGLPIIPVMAEAVRMPLWIRHLQVLDFSEQALWAELLGAIEGHIAGNISDLNPVAPPTKAKERSNREDSRPIVRPFTVKQQTGIFPKWASNAGIDEYGQYADLEVKSVTQRFRLIQPGTFQMGSPESEKEREPWSFSKETLHQVTLSQAFWLADTTCTQSLWSVVMGNNPAYFTANENNPVEQVSWNDAQGFFETLSRLKSGLSFQLPTEAQWEYACRAGSQTPFSFGENITPEQVNYNGNHPYTNARKRIFRDKTVPVKFLAANQWGLYEMHGNVWEWCQDAFQKDLGSQACRDPLNQSEASVPRVLRGGSWYNYGGGCRSAFRRRFGAGGRDDDVGFRLSLVN